MRAYLATNMMGVFAFNDSKKLIGHRLFPKKPDVISEKMDKVSRGDIIPEEKDLIRDLIRLGYKEIVWDKKTQEKGGMYIYKPDNLGKKTLSEEFRKLAIELRWVSSQAELNELLSNISVSITKEKLRETRKDKILMQGIGVLDEIDRVINVFSERLREWYGLYFPEALEVIQDNEQLVKVVSEFGAKGSIKNHKLARYVKDSAGMEFSEDDIKKTMQFSDSILNLYKTKKSLTEYLEKSATETIPNITAVTGPLLGLRLLSLAGGLEKISRMPTSTIQLLGAEKALFRHLRGEGKAPKYGIIFSHQHVQNAPKDVKGKMARLVAAKISLASRMDFFSKENKGEEIRSKLNEEVSRVLKRKENQK